MIYKKLKVLSWNCRRLGLVDKCNVVCEVIRSSRCDVVLLQQTKLNELSLSYTRCFLPSFFNPSCVYNLADRSKGGIIIAWKNNFELLKSWSTYHMALALLKNKSTNVQTIFFLLFMDLVAMIMTRLDSLMN